MPGGRPHIPARLLLGQQQALDDARSGHTAAIQAADSWAKPERWPGASGRVWEQMPPSPPLSPLQINSYPPVAPQHPPHQLPIPASPIPALPSAAHVPTLNPITLCPPRGLGRHHATSHHGSSPPGGPRRCIGDLHVPRAGNGAGSKPLRCLILHGVIASRPSPARGTQQGCSSATSQEISPRPTRGL